MGHGTLKGRTSPKQPGANPRLGYSGSPAPDRQAIVLEPEDLRKRIAERAKELAQELGVARMRIKA